MESSHIESTNDLFIQSLLLPAEVAEQLRVAPSWVYAHAEQIPGFVPVGRYVRFRRAVFERWLEGTGTCQ